jgi:hypothetical protein
MQVHSRALHECKMDEVFHRLYNTQKADPPVDPETAAVADTWAGNLRGEIRVRPPRAIFPAERGTPVGQWATPRQHGRSVSAPRPERNNPGPSAAVAAARATRRQAAAVQAAVADRMQEAEAIMTAMR